MDEKEENELASMSLGDHLEELRTRLLRAIIGLFAGLIVCLFFGIPLLEVLATPYKAMMTELSLPMLQTHELTEGFMIYLKTCLFFGLVLSSPWVIWQIWAFVASGLYMKEKKYIYAVAPATTILFITGSLYFATIIAPLMMKFLVVFNNKIDFVSTNWTFKSYIGTILSLAIVFGVAFQMPVLVVFAQRMKLVTIKQLTSSRKFVILALVVVSAMATPPDFISQIMLALPLYMLYEIAIIICRVLRKYKKK